MPKVFLKSKFLKTQKHAVNYLCYLNRQSPLFSGAKEVALKDALAEIQKSGAICWSHILSLKQEDVQRLEIDRQYMKALLESQKDRMAKAYHISPQNLILYASYHNVGHHPHLHFIMQSKSKSEGYIVRREGQSMSEAGAPSRNALKSILANAIFREDLHDLKVRKSDLREEFQRQMKYLVEIGKANHRVPPDAVEKMTALKQVLQQTQGKKVYGFSPESTKRQTDDLLKILIAQDAVLNGLYQEYRSLHEAMLKQLYIKNPNTLAQKMAEWEENFFHPQKGMDTGRHNIIIRSAANLGERYTKKSDSTVKQEQQFPQEQNGQHNATNGAVEQYKKEYHYKTQESAMKSMMYHIGYSLRDDAKRLYASGGYAPQQSKIRAKKIQKQTQVDNIEQIQVGGRR